MTQNDQVNARIQGVLQGADLSEPKYLSDGSVEVIASVPMEKVYRAVQDVVPAQPVVIRAQPVQ